MTPNQKIAMLESELASERCTTVGLRKHLEDVKRDIFEGFARVMAELRTERQQVQILKAKYEPVTPNLLPVHE